MYGNSSIDESTAISALCAPGEQAPGRCPSVPVTVLWEEWLTANVFWPGVVQIAATLLFLLVLHPAYSALSRMPTVSHVMVRIVGVQGKEAQRSSCGRICAVVCYFVQFFATCYLLFAWVTNVYRRYVSEIMRQTSLACAFVTLVLWLLSRLRQEFRVSGVWGLSSLIDCLTIVPCIRTYILGVEKETNWLTLHYLRFYFLLHTLFQIRESGMLDRTNMLSQMIVITVLRVLCLVVMIAGTIFILEVLGDPSVMSDSFIETSGGDSVSFFQMLYFTVITLTTVGYGDFSPRTLISRFCMTGFVVLGFSYILWVQFALQQAWVEAREGSGSYNPWGLKDPHVVIILCTNSSPSQCASLIDGFLHEVLHNEQKPWPNIVIMSPAMWNVSGTSFAEFLVEQGFPPGARRRVWYLVGDAANKKDLERAAVGRSVLTFLVPDTHSLTPDDDDERCIYTALTIRKRFREARLRLMLHRPESKELALQEGIELTRCFALRELKANILAQNVACHGFLPMIMAMLKSADDTDMELALQHARAAQQDLRSAKKQGPDSVPYGGAEKWMADYMHGLQCSLYGFALSDQFVSWSFKDIVPHVYEATGAIIIGVFVDGRFELIPDDRGELEINAICFALAPGAESLKPVSSIEDPNSWRRRIFEARSEQLDRALNEGPHVAASELIGRDLRSTLLITRTSRRSHRPSRFNSSMSASFSGASAYSDDDGDDMQMSTLGVEREPGPYSHLIPEQFGNTNTPSAGMRKKKRSPPDAWRQVQTLRKNLQQNEELILLLVCHGEVWQQVSTFIGTLRAHYTPVKRPIVMVTPNAMPGWLIEECAGQGVVAVRGSCTKAANLLDAGLKEASAVVVMNGEVPRGDNIHKAAIYQDARISLCAGVLECWCGISEREVFTSYELQDNGSLTNFPPLIPRPAVALEHLFRERSLLLASDDGTTSLSTDEDEAVHRKRPVRKKSMFAPFVGEKTRATDVREETPILLNARFAAGQVFSPAIWGAMLGRMYSLPATTEIMEALAMPQKRGQAVYPYQIRVPKIYVRAELHTLVRDLADSSFAKKLHPEYHTDVSRDSVSTDRHSTVLFAIYRKNIHLLSTSEWKNTAAGTGGFYYTMLAPPPDTVIMPNDWALVYGSSSFGREMLSLGLLRGSYDALALSENENDGSKMGSSVGSDGGSEGPPETCDERKPWASDAHEGEDMALGIFKGKQFEQISQRFEKTAAKSQPKENRDAAGDAEEVQDGKVDSESLVRV
eukprot:TRINITY_DN4760_c0_g1_i6.p1 TRINITY_DN4760_c0_g1~~TRINITY_DN4760_c0_g1_i6.p1  ORF type:complete len:1250 (+),score=172.90 TRINITY_DN4760_c0_g1_i6:109-3858(+)